MAQNLPPTEDVPLFDTNNFKAGDFSLTYNDAKTKFLTYPYAQGKENLQEIDVSGVSTFRNTLTITNGTTANTLSNTDWTGTIKTQNSTQNLTHYINMSDSSSTGQGNPQKSTLITCNPSTGIITCSGINAPIYIISDNTTGTYYIPFIKSPSSTGSFHQLYTDDISKTLNYNPTPGTLGATNVIFNTVEYSATIVSGTLNLGNVTTSTIFSTTVIYTGGISTINTITGSTIVNNGYVDTTIWNNGTGALTITNTLTCSISPAKVSFTSPVVIPIGSYAIVKVVKNTPLNICIIDVQLLY